MILARALLDLENQRDATDAVNLQRDSAEERIAELEDALEQLAGQDEGALKSLEQQLAEALAAKVKAEGERQNLTEDLQAALAARLAADALADERLSALEQRENSFGRSAAKSLGVSEDLTEKRANELIEAAKQQELLNQQVGPPCVRNWVNCRNFWRSLNKRTLLHKSNCRTLETA